MAVKVGIESIPLRCTIAPPKSPTILELSESAVGVTSLWQRFEICAALPIGPISDCPASARLNSVATCLPFGLCLVTPIQAQGLLSPTDATHSIIAGSWHWSEVGAGMDGGGRGYRAGGVIRVWNMAPYPAPCARRSATRTELGGRASGGSLGQHPCCRRSRAAVS